MRNNRTHLVHQVFPELFFCWFVYCNVEFCEHGSDSSTGLRQWAGEVASGLLFIRLRFDPHRVLHCLLF